VIRYKNRLLLFAAYILIIAIFQDIGLMIAFSFYIVKGIVLGGYVFWKNTITEEEEFTTTS